MKRYLFACVLTLAACAGLSWSGDMPAAEGGKAVTVKGEVIEMACYMTHEGKGPKHTDCAKMCAVGGAPIGLEAADGTVYLLIEDHASAKAQKPYHQAKKLVAEKVTVTGQAFQRGGLQAIVVEGVTKN